MWQNTQRHYSSNLHVWLELTDPLRAHSVQLYSEKPQLPGLSRGTRLLTATIVLSRHGAFPSTKHNAAPFSIRQGLCPFGITNPSPLHLRKGKEVSVPKGLHPFKLLYGQPSISCTQVVKIPPWSREEPLLWIPIWNNSVENATNLGEKKNVAGLQWHPFLFWRHSNLDCNLSSFCILYNKSNPYPCPHQCGLPFDQLPILQTKSISYKIRNKIKVSSITNLIQHSVGRLGSKTEETKGMGQGESIATCR